MQFVSDLEVSFTMCLCENHVLVSNIYYSASEILHTSVKNSLEGTRHTVTIAFVQQDGNVHRLLLASDDGVSVLNHLVLTGEGTRS